MPNGKKLLSRGVKVHPVFIIGIVVGLVSLGSLLGVTVFSAIAGSVGVSVTILSLEWLVVSFITIFIGIWRSFEVVADVE